MADVTAEKGSEANTVLLLVMLIEVLPQSCGRRESDQFENEFSRAGCWPGGETRWERLLSKTRDEQGQHILETM